MPKIGHTYTAEHDTYILEAFETLQSDGTPASRAATQVLREFNVRFQANVPSIDALLQHLYKLRTKSRKNGLAAPDSAEFIVASPSVSGRGETFDYAKDQFELQGIYSRLLDRHGKVPENTRVYRRCNVQFKVSLNIDGLANSKVG